MRTCLPIVILAAFLSAAAIPAAGQPVCDTLYTSLQNLTVEHIQANEVFIEYYIACPPADQAFGGVILSRLGEDGKNDRAIIAVYIPRAGWSYCFGERAPNVRFLRPSPLLDVDGDGELDLVCTTFESDMPGDTAYRITLMAQGKKRAVPSLNFPPGLAIDSLLPAPEGRPRPLQVVDRRGRSIGGLNAATAPVSYRYLEWDAGQDPPGYVNRTASHRDRYPELKRRAAYIDSLPQSDLLEFSEPEEYARFLANIVGYGLDQSNLGREAEGFIEARAILDRVRYSGSTQVLGAPVTVTDELQRALPDAQSIPRRRK